jgi:SNF2 family DNA or RNA helicase
VRSSDGGHEADFEADVPHGALTVPLLRHQRRALAWMSRREGGAAPVGGLLADDQGLGKTLTTISLIVSRRPPPRPAVRAAALAPGAPVAAGTLVVCPTSVLRQWARELRARVSSAAALSVLLYHGPGRSRSALEVARYDVVLTTYAIVSQELAPLKSASAGSGGDDASPAASGGSGGSACAPAAPAGPQQTVGVLGNLTWWRVVLDEAQSIKNARSQVAASVWALRARRRWCLSGTPLQNSVDDLYSYFRFLHYAPYDDLPAFRARIREPIRACPAAGFAALQRVLQTVMLRRTKATRIGGEPIVKLPPRTVSLQAVDFSARERGCYAQLQAEYRHKFAEFRAAGTVSTNYVNILYMLLRLRQACNHLGLAATAGASGAKAPAAEVAAAKKLPEGTRAALLAAADASRSECPLCCDLPEEPVVAPCGAIFCKACWAQHAAGAGSGPPAAAAAAAATAAANAAAAGVAAGAAAAAAGASAPSAAAAAAAAVAAAAAAGDDGRDPCPSCGAAHAAGDAHSAAALRAAGPKEKAAASVAASSALPTSAAAAAAAWDAAPGGSGLEASCKLRAVIAYLRDLRHRTGGVSPLRGGGAGGAGAGGKKGGKKDRAVVQRDKGEQLRAGIKSSDAALAAALPPLPPVAFSALRAGGGGAGAAGLAAPPEKVIIFSQWTGMLNLLEPALRDEGFAFRRLDGTMSLAAREKALHEFETRHDVRVMLMSLKAAGLGVNLVCANHVLLLDVWWNPTVEEQAIDRSHRIGQTRQVHVARFTVRDTVEDRIIALQEHKRALAAAAFGEEPVAPTVGAGGAAGASAACAASAAAGGAERSKLTVEDLLFLFTDSSSAGAAGAAAPAGAAEAEAVVTRWTEEV